MNAAPAPSPHSCFPDVFSYQYCCLGVGSRQLGNPRCWSDGYSYDSCCLWRGSSFKFDEVLYSSNLSASHVRANSTSGRPAAARGPRGVVHLVFYHKTGTVLGTAVAKALREQLQMRVESEYIWQANLQHPGHFGFRQPVLHFVRDPVKLIVSAYAYHAQKPGLENWLHRPGFCSGEYPKMSEGRLSTTYPEDCSWIFDGCSNLCNYYDILEHAGSRRLSKTLFGLLVEYRHMRREVDEMLRRLRGWLNKPWVLHLSVEHFAAAFEGTVGCVAHFLRLTPEQTSVFVKAMLPAARPRHEEHVTQGRRGSATEEMQQLLLLVSAAWEAQFRRIRATLAAVDRRQASSYGCPAIADAEESVGAWASRVASFRRAGLVGDSLAGEPQAEEPNASGEAEAAAALPEACFGQGYTPAVCCSRRWGPRGLEQCWDLGGIFTYERCCELPRL